MNECFPVVLFSLQVGSRDKMLNIPDLMVVSLINSYWNADEEDVETTITFSDYQKDKPQNAY
jgi:hypothetical protein